MLKLLLVDDEDIEIHGLIAMIKTFGLPIEVCATARNGKEGLQKARIHKPHVVITDLRMPQMNGVEMLKQLDIEYKGTQFVLISGFEDFHAARKVLELGTLAYLLKPVGRDELFRILCKCCSLSQCDSSSEFTANRPVFSTDDEQFIRRLLFASGNRIRELLTEHPHYGNFFIKTIFSVATVEITPTNNQDIFDYTDTLHSFAKKHNSPAPVFIDNAKAAVVLNAPAFVEDDVFIDNIIKKAENLQLDLCKMNIHDVFIGVSDTATDPCALPILYKQSLQVLEQRFQNSLSHVFFYDSKEETLVSSSEHGENHVIKHIQKIIKEEFAKPLSIDIIAERLFLSPSHIRRLFKNNTGVTIMDYLESVRLNHARYLLSQRQHKIHEIGVLVGYDSPSYFNMVFKKYYGVTPGDYRKSLGI